MESAEWISSDEGRLWIAYQRGSQLLERTIDQHLRLTAGLSHPEFEILSRLAAAPEHRMRMGALAALLVSPKTRLNYQISQLAERGLVAREPYPDDGRGLNAVLTEAGLRIFLEVVPGLIANVRENFIAHLVSGEQAQLAAIMNRVADNIERSAALVPPQAG